MKIGRRENREHLEYRDIRYYRYTDRADGHCRGEVVISSGRERRVIKDYPHIFRVYRMHEGIKRYFGNGSFYAEEKIDGYNIRMVRHGGMILALTRGGIICPFTTEWAEFWRGIYRFDDFFDEYPAAALCAELVGDNPYNSKRDSSVPPGLSFLCFDIMNRDGSFVPVEEKYMLFEKYGLPGVRTFGKFTAGSRDELTAIMLDLNTNRREGLVLKKQGSGGAIKFVTAASDLVDLEQFLAYFYDIEPGFYSNRLMRISLFVQEFGLDSAEYSRRIGDAVLCGYDRLRDYGGSFENFTLYTHTHESWKAVKKFILRHVDIVRDELTSAEINGMHLFRVTFMRKHRKSTARYREILSGHEE